MRKNTEEEQKNSPQPNVFQQLWQKIKQLSPLAIFLGELTYWSPLIITALLALLIDAGYWGAFAAIYGVWVGILPAIPIQVAFIFGYHKLISFISRNKRDKGDKKC